MPITDDQVWELIKNLREENALLLNALLHKDSLLEHESKVEIPEGMKSVGKKPWHVLKAELEVLSHKPRLSEITGIPEKDQEDASVFREETT